MKYGWKTVLVFVVLVALMLIYQAVTHTFVLFEAVLAILCLLLLAGEQYRISQKRRAKWPISSPWSWPACSSCSGWSTG